MKVMVNLVFSMKAGPCSVDAVYRSSNVAICPKLDFTTHVVIEAQD